MTTILLVDDDEAIRSLVRALLEAVGYAVLDASHAGEALAVCSHHDGPIHLLLTDLTMPGVGGCELAERALKLRPEMKVLCMSGSTWDEAGCRQVEEGIYPFLQKPFTLEALEAAVRAALGSEVARR